MPKKISKFTQSIKELAEIQVNEWELPEVLRKDISELEIREHLQRLGNLQITEWEIKDLIPALQKLARKEVDIIGLLKQAAEYKIIDWEGRPDSGSIADGRPLLDDTQLDAITRRLRSYLEFTICSLIDEPHRATFHHEEIAPQVVRFRVILKQRDLSMLVGSQGRTSKPIRSLLKAAALRHGIHALLQIQSYEEAARSEHHG